MKNIRLYIGGKRADLDGSLNIPFTYQTSDSQMPTAVKNSYSKTVTLQGTEQNRRIFDGLWRLDSRVKDVKAREPEYIADYTETDAEFTSRAVPSVAQGDVLKATAVKGKSIVWNQLVVNGDFSNGINGWNQYTSNVTRTVTDGVCKMVATNATRNPMQWRAISIPASHKVYLSVNLRITTDKTISFNPAFLYPSNRQLATSLPSAGYASWKKISGILTAGSNDRRLYVGMYGTSASDMLATGDIVEISQVQLIDLTAAGLDDLTAAEFEALYPDYHSYNAGELVNNAASGVEMLDAGGNSLGTIPLNITGLTSGGVQIFPDGMKSAGSVADEWSGTTAIKRIGVVDLGTLTWTRTAVSGSGLSYSYYFRSSALNPIIAQNTRGQIGNLIISGSLTLVASQPLASATAGLNTMDNSMMHYYSASDRTLYARADSYTSAADFKAAMSGVYLYYELATPVTYTTDQPLPDTLVPFESGGTQRRLPVDTESSVLAPFVGSFEYGHIQTYPLPYHFNPMKRVPFLLYVDEMVVERGYCQLVAINRKSRGYTFSLSLFGGLGEFFYNLQTDEEGETKSLADLDFGQDLGFTINAAKVQEVWDDLIAGNLPTIGFVPMHNGAPASVDSKKALIKGGGLPTSIVDGSDTYSQKLGYILASLERKYTEWEIGDLRSYLQRPALRFKDFLAAVCNPANNGGWTVNLDSGFFNEDNPYYEKTYLLLPQLNVEESTDEICDDGSVQAVSDYPTTATKVQTLQPVSSCLTLDGTYIDLSGSASNAYVKVSLPIQLAVTGLTNQGDLYLTNRVSHHTENKTICMMAAAYDEDGSPLAVSNRYVFTSKSHRNETGDVKKPAAPVATTDAQIDGYFTYQGGEYVFRTDDNAANIFALVIDKIPRPSSSGHKIQVRFYIQMTTDGIPTLNTKRKGENSSNVNVSNTQFSCRILEGSNNNVSLVEPTQYASDSRVSQEALLNSLEQSPLEILLSYTKTFGLMWIQDNLQNSVSLYKRENYYTGEVSDIHNRIDYGKGWKATPVSAESNNYTLENEYPETTLSKAYESDYGRTYGGVRLKVGYDFGKEKIETMEKVELKGYVEGALSGSGYWKYRNADGNLPSPIADGMKVTYYKESGGETQTKDVEYNLFNVTAITKTNSPALGVACLNEDGEEKAVEVAPALVMLQGGAMGGTFYLSDDVAAMATLNNGPCWIWDESRAVARIPRFARVATFDGETYSLDFGTPRMTYYIPEVSLAPEQAVYARYWERYLTDLLDRNTKKVECYVVFPPHLDMRQEMRKFYLFDRTLWVLNKVTDYDATKEQSVKCEFIRVNLKGNYVNE